ncbi:MAG: hypothetical protein U0T82_17620 [Bacteroidales bacterium]
MTKHLPGNITKPWSDFSRINKQVIHKQLQKYKNIFLIPGTSKNTIFITHPYPRPNARLTGRAGIHPGGLSAQVKRELRGVFRGSLKDNGKRQENEVQGRAQSLRITENLI